MDLESEIVRLGLKVSDLERENKVMRDAIVLLDENDSHTKTILTVLWADLKKRNEESVGVLYG